MHRRAASFKTTAQSEYDVDIDVHEFDEGTKTAADAAAAIGCDIAQIASGLVFAADGEPVMVVTSGANHVDERRLGEAVGATTVEMAAPETVRDATGYSIGGVPPFCHEGSVPVFVDETLLEFEDVWAAAGTPDAVFPIDPDTLVTLADATAIRVS